MKIVNTDNFGGDYPNESFLNIPPLPGAACKKIADAINEALSPNASRWYKVVPDDYQLAPGFEP
jgi:hypothetical protein